MTLKHIFVTLGLLLIGLLHGCGSSSTTTADNGGIGGTGMTSGTVTSYGSIFVNGIEFFTDAQTIITLDGVNVIDEQDVEIGMVVTIQGTVAADGLTGDADTIVFRDELEGPVSANNVDVDGSLTIMGHTVMTTATTVFADATGTYAKLADIPGDGTVVVEVSGYPDGLGTVYATRVEVTDDNWVSGDSAIEVSGIVQNHNAAAFTFDLGSLTVYYAGAIGAENVANDTYVEVHSSAGFNGSNQLIASQIELESGGDLSVDGTEGDEFEIEGIVTTALSGNLFYLNGQAVRISGSTEIGAEVLTSLSVVGTMVEVDGVLAADGVIDADEVEGRSEATIHIAAEVEGASTSTINVLGLTVTIDNNTVITDETATIVWPLNVVSLDGSYVEVEVGRDATDNLVAARLEIEDVTAPLPAEVEIEGEITSTLPLAVEGVLVDPNGLSLGGKGLGDELSVLGSWDGSTVTASAIE